MNMGTSFLVAPIYTNKPEILANTMKVKQFLIEKNEAYIKAMNPDDDQENESNGSAKKKQNKKNAN